jgi:hypothetical protein
MNNGQREQLVRALIHSAQLPPDYEDFEQVFKNLILAMCRPPPNALMDLRNRLFSDYEAQYLGRNVFDLISSQRYEFFEITGESQETFIQLVNSVPFSENNNTLSRRNSLLLVVIWLRTYPTYRTLSVFFNISVSSVKDTVRGLLPKMDGYLKQFIEWPTINEWQNLRWNWPKIVPAVGAIDGTSHEIYRPKINQQQYFSGHRHYHCLHSQIVIDNTGKIRHVETGFFGHQNDAQQYQLMRHIGNDLFVS